tara:strand:+ start:44 stop:586 length:543 start_codon:yes stop_codon:yes gene_type:complete
MANRDTGFTKPKKEEEKKSDNKGLELTLDKFNVFGEKEMQKLLSNKDKLVKQKTKDGRNQYQVEIQKLKDKLKAQTKKAKDQGFKIKYKFNDLLNHVKRQEREGKFDRGAEGKAKNKLRKKMAKQAEDIFTSGRHKGSQAGDYIDKGMSKMDSKATVKLSQDLTGTKKKKKPNKVNLGSR